MVKLVAADCDDGYAFVEEDGSKFAVRPPYKERIRVSDSTVERAITVHGFSAEDRSFLQWRDLVQYLTSQFIERRKKFGYGEPDTAQTRRLGQRAPRNIVENYLTRIQDELIVNEEFGPAINLLTSLLKNDVVREDLGLWERCTDLVERCHLAKERQAEERLGLISSNEVLAEEFPLAFEYYGENVFEIARKGRAERQVLVVGGG